MAQGEATSAFLNNFLSTAVPGIIGGIKDKRKREYDDQKELEKRRYLEELKKQERDFEGGLLKDRYSREDSKRTSDEAFRNKQFEADQKYKNRSLDLMSQRDQNNRKEESLGKTIPQSAVEQLSFADSAEAQLKDLREIFTQSKNDIGPVQGRLRALYPWDSKMKTLIAETGKSAQAIGKYLEGGKMTDADRDFYKQDILPTESDSYEVAMNKIANMERLIAKKRESDINALKAAGYNTGNFNQRPVPGLITGGGKLPGLIAGPSYESMSDEELDRLMKKKGIQP